MNPVYTTRLGGVMTLSVLLAVMAVVSLARNDAENATAGSLTLKASYPVTPPAAPELEEFRADSVRQLAHWYSARGYSWPPQPGEAIPALAPLQLPGDLNRRSISERKELFLQALLPVVLAENQRILEQRHRLSTLFEIGHLVPGTGPHDEVAQLARRYRVRGDLNQSAVRERLLARVDAIPTALTLAQAALESGWGTSRFAREGNSLFGVWTWRKGAGLTPRNRDEGATHSVRAYSSLRAAVRAYMANLNTVGAYGEFRRLRQQTRSKGLAANAIELAAGLTPYSARGEAYVREVQRMIRGNQLTALNGINLAG